VRGQCVRGLCERTVLSPLLFAMQLPNLKPRNIDRDLFLPEVGSLLQIHTTASAPRPVMPCLPSAAHMHKCSRECTACKAYSAPLTQSAQKHSCALKGARTHIHTRTHAHCICPMCSPGTLEESGREHLRAAGAWELWWGLLSCSSPAGNLLSRGLPVQFARPPPPKTDPWGCHQTWSRSGKGGTHRAVVVLLRARGSPVQCPRSEPVMGAAMAALGIGKAARYHTGC